MAGENVIVAVTYQTIGNSIQQFIATYGDRGDGMEQATIT